MLISLVLAASRARAFRPEITFLYHETKEGQSGRSEAAKLQKNVCFLQKDNRPDGVGHQLFSMLTVMGAHGVVGDTGLCYVYDARPREFVFQHMDKESQSWKEAMDLMTGFYADFGSKIGPKGCATAELMANAPEGDKPVAGNPWLLHDVCQDNKFTTWSLDNLYYGSDVSAFNHKQLRSKPQAFMQAVINNASQLAVLASAHLPHVSDVPHVAVHMRFGDRAKFLLPMAEGQQVLFQRYRFPSPVSQLPSVRVFSDNTDEAKSYLAGTTVANADFCGPECSTALQAMASMVAAEVFVGSLSDLSSTAALMRIGLGKKHTFMPSSWQWAHGFTGAEVNIYDISDHHQESCHDHCDSDQSDWCYWCGRHQTDSGLKWMNCCQEGASYSQDHKCHGVAYSPERAGQHQCVTMLNWPL